MGIILVQVAIGGAAGATCRYLTVTGVERLLGDEFSHGTILVNILGSLLMGVVFAVAATDNSVLGRIMPLVAIGFLGGYTTFSAFSLDFWSLYVSGRLMAAFTYALVSVFLSVAALFLGIAVARGVTG